MGTSFRSFQPYGPAAALDAMADARVEETRTGELTRANWLPDTLEDAAAAGLTDIDTTQAIRTPDRWPVLGDPAGCATRRSAELAGQQRSAGRREGA
jgi:hypothetical protein